MRLTVFVPGHPDPHHVTIAGPADLFRYGAGTALTIHALGDVAEQARWASVIGLYALRGGDVTCSV